MLHANYSLKRTAAYRLLCYHAVRGSGRLAQALAMQVDTQSRMVVRPVFAAVVFGFLASLFAALSILLMFFGRGQPLEIFTGVSVLAPCAPLLYFAARGFVPGVAVPFRTCRNARVA